MQEIVGAATVTGVVEAASPIPKMPVRWPRIQVAFGLVIVMFSSARSHPTRV